MFMYRISFVCMLFLQSFVYLASYYVTQAMTLRKLQNIKSPLASARNHVVLLGVSLGSILAVYFGHHLPVIALATLVAVLSVYLWLTDSGVT